MAGERQVRIETTTATNSGSGPNRPNPRRHTERINRVMLGVLVSTGLIGAACLNGLPSTTCYALADAYAIALHTTGFIFGLVFGVFFAIACLEEEPWISDQYKDTLRFKVVHEIVIFGVFGLGFICLSFITLTASTGAVNIRLAIDHCYLSNGKNVLHDKIPLFRDPIPIFGRS
jgi:hypothetical protein